LDLSEVYNERDLPISNDWLLSLSAFLPSSSVESLSIKSQVFSTSRLQLLAPALAVSPVTHLSLSFDTDADFSPIVAIQPRSRIISLTLCNEDASSFTSCVSKPH
jgi:hypothetical protein